ncbi:RDD family protein [Marinoscillum pacificum]|uniref:RDD family protein n=1 Tax=Marinoscillum pacificum TaxID=392723 RepID=UPI00215803F0|nr:RDD family protein [Marinoscillum pacificum]
MSTTNYAGFWLRFVAMIIDYIIIGALQTIVIFPILGIFGIDMAMNMSNGNMSDEQAIAAAFAAISTMGSVFLVSSLISILYYTILEASKFEATFGKMALGLKVTDTEGRPLDFGKSLLRNLGKIVSQTILFIGYIIAGFTDKKQALHDMIAGALVVKK